MDNYEAILKVLLEAVKSTSSSETASKNSIPVGISNRHVHLSSKDLDTLFGKGYQLTKIKDLSQPGQYACKETVTICGPKGAIENVRILGPVRDKTQVEVLSGDCFKLGVSAPVRLSGVLSESPGITLVGSKGSVLTDEGLVIAQRHIHMTLEDASRFGVCDGQIVSIKVDGLRGGIYDNTAIRANNSSALECHLDVEEANAMGVNSSTQITIINNK